MNENIEKKVNKIMELMAQRAKIEVEIAVILGEPVGMILPMRKEKPVKQKVNGGG